MKTIKEEIGESKSKIEDAKFIMGDTSDMIREIYNILEKMEIKLNNKEDKK